MTSSVPRQVPPEPSRAEVAHLRRLAMRDELTGLANRRAFLERLGDEISRARRHATPFSLVLLDLDGLKDLNDTFGHQAGDAALRHFARALRRAVRTKDLVARIGGDEFAVIGVHDTVDEGLTFSDRVRGVAGGLVRRVIAHGQPVRLSAAYGVATWEAADHDARSLFARAESALVVAKNTAVSDFVTVAGVYRPRGRRALGEELRHLLGMARHVSSAREVEELGRAAAEQASFLIGARMAWVAMPRSDGCTGFEERYTDGVWIPDARWFAPGEGMIGRVMQTAEPYIVRDTATDPYVDQEAVARLELRSGMGLPLRGQDGTALGIITLANKLDGRAFTPSDMGLGMAFADLVATAITNVRSREQSDAALAYTSALMEQAHDAIYVTDPETRRILEANAAAEQMSGYTREELLTMRAPDLRPADDRDGAGTTDMVRERTAVLTLSRRHQRKDGTIIPVEVSARRAQTPRGEVVINIVRDVSERAAHEQALRQRNRELQARNDVAAVLAGADDDATAMQRVLTIVTEALGVEGAFIAQREPGADEMRITAALNLPESLRDRLVQRVYHTGVGMLGEALAGGLLVVEDTHTDARQFGVDVRASGVRSIVIAPMVAQGRKVGVISVGSYAPSRFGEAEIGLVRGVADQAALWLENRRLLADTQRREREARFLAELGEMLNRTRDLDQIVKRLVRRVSEATGRGVIVFLRDTENEQWHVAQFYHPNASHRRRVAAMLHRMPPRTAGGLTSLAASQREPMLVRTDDPTLSSETADRLRRLGLTSVLAAPLRIANRTFGVITAGAAAGEEPLTEHHVRHAADIARFASAAIANAIARRDLLARNHELALVNDISALVEGAGSSAELHDAVVARVQRAFGAAAVLLRLHDAESKTLVMAAHAGLTEEMVTLIRDSRVAVGNQLAGVAASTRRPVVIGDWTVDPRATLALRGKKVPHPVIVVPLISGDQIVGTLAIVGQPHSLFASTDTRRLTAVAGTLAAALARFAAFEQAEQSSRYARALFESASDALFVSDPDTHRIIDANAAAERLTGYSREELLDLPPNALREPRARGLETLAERTMREGTITIHTPGALLRKDGAEVLVEVSSSVVEQSNRKMVLGIVRDVSERARQEEQLRFQAQILTSVHDAVVATDLNRRVIYWNQGAETLYGWTAREILGETIDRIIPAGAEMERVEQMHSASPADTWRAERPRICKDGRRIWCSLQLSGLRDEAGAPIGILSVARDVTARREAEAEALAARDEAARHAAEFAAAARASRLVADGGSPDIQLERLTSHIADVTGFGVVALTTYDESTDYLQLRTLHHRLTPPPEQLLRNYRLPSPIMRASFLRVAAMEQPEVIHRAYDAPPDVTHPTHWTRVDRIDTLVRTVLRYDGRPVGHLLLGSREAIPVTDTEMRLYKMLADQASLAVHNALEFDRLREMRRDAIFRLAAACEARDPETSLHLQQILSVTESLARELAMSPDDVEDLSLASVLHDVGKIRTPDAILWKPGRLGREEMMVMRLHAADGEQMLAGPAFYTTARQVARSHHERWDGSGYPDGLAGEQIPMGARIVAVADVFDALTARRSYKAAWPAERAAGEIICQAGRLFDPRVVEAFEALWHSNRLTVRPEQTPR
ncbi:MAG: PAS domain S-box protein [Chloroflexi bacterium]|nr:PAS domain S-box protein [Chloroflexota bacterium]